MTVLNGDCRHQLATLEDDSVDACVTDPPYGLEFMGKDWDSFRTYAGGNPNIKPQGAVAADEDGWQPGRQHGYRQKNPRCRRCGKLQRGNGCCKCPEPQLDTRTSESAYQYQTWAEDVFREVWRVLKPGAYLLAFGGTRTYHRLACAIEDAGFEVRDSIGVFAHVIAWCYGSGFPKSRNISADPMFCQCVRELREDAAPEAAEPAAEVLLDHMRGRSETSEPRPESVHGVRDVVHADDPIPGHSEQDVLATVRGRGGVASGDRQTVPAQGAARGAFTSQPADGCALRELHGPGGQVTEQNRSLEADLLLNELPVEGSRGHTGGEQVRPHREEGPAALRGSEPSMEGRGHPQASEGQLHGGSVPAGAGVGEADGSGGRVHHGAPAGDGRVGGPIARADRGGEPRGSRPVEQRSVEPGSVAVERGPQAWRGGPVCDGCGKPVVPAGLGTALKPAWEPVIVARKPLAGTVAHNVTVWGVGGLNIDATRIPIADGDTSGFWTHPRKPSGAFMLDGCSTVDELRELAVQDAQTPNGRNARATLTRYESRTVNEVPQGRWPANTVLAHHPDCDTDCHPDCWVRKLDEQSGDQGYGGSGGASRFFPTFRYEPKAPTRERPKVDGVAHPTVKPLALIRWLCRLVTPPGGLILDPFLGSGTTAEAAELEGFRWVGCESNDDYLPLIEARLNRVTQPSLPLEASA